MKKVFWLITSVLLMLAVVTTSFSISNFSKKNTLNSGSETAANSTLNRFGQFVTNIYQSAGLQAAGLDESVFQKALTGYYNLKLAHKLPENSNTLTVVDFSKPSHTKRMWIIDLASKSLLLNTWVAHGQGSGDDMANQFSNNNESHQSSLGFYVTDDIYFGKHGRSLRLDGMDAGFNDKARQRSIVVHAADYVCQNTINQLGRIGRSFGCPAVSPEVIDQVITNLKGKTLLFINGSDSHYTSKYLNENLAASLALPDSAINNAQTLRAAAL
ncbi:murein L,D-transpeptidase catalytic domain family protein [Mucilaginibacter sp. KACC 22063]|uniref:murein L,D-transpeptidase catalytic domain family protein n=1 Tax=Mucilaginibacter sp. KACC 22063 TaxID=3025666 RepID=UPI002366C468|nr:murein L,D-transpeptidase catalytic domain family protein [Mucilaginibacter sp. KACC 22063]WDF54323.1 murein L,D-transpeptidase catalytic domain family protein [Mucilaginibacter sp. KACC 22063]